MFARLRNRFEISPQRYAQVTVLALIGLSLIVLTGAAVRLTDSGLGCPDWPQCYGAGAHPPLESHAIIESANRIVTGLLGVVVIAACILAFFRRPYRRHLAIFGALLPLGVIAQALLDAGFALMWCSRYEPWDRRRSWDRTGVWAVRGLIPLGQLTILAGTVATGSGPHAGEFEGQFVQRFDFMGSDTLEWVVQRHAVLATIYGLAAIGVWFYLRRPGGDRRALKPLTVVLLLLLLQGILGYVQWELELPPEIVWFHVAIATF